MQVKAKAELLRYTQNPEQTVALAARLCYSGNPIDELIEKINASDYNTFITKLLDLGHLSPFEHASFTFAVEGVSRALLAQITRHRIASFSVRSQRYVSENDFNYVIPPAIEQLGEKEKNKYIEQMETMLGWYREWQGLLGANEDARFVLPNACETKMIITMNARELMHFFQLRCCNRAQWEIRGLAWQMLEQVISAAPALFARCGSACCFGACSEGKMSCGKVAEMRAMRKKLDK